MVNKLLSITFIVFVLTSCGLFPISREEAIDEDRFTYFMKEDPRTIKSNLSLNGVYVKKKGDYFPSGSDSAFKACSILILYSNGLFYRTGIGPCFYEDKLIERNITVFEFDRSWPSAWGAFIMERGRIKMQTFNPKPEWPPRIYPLETFEGTILNESTIKVDEYRTPYGETHYVSSVYNFYPLENKPDSLSWMMENPILKARAGWD